MTSPDPNRSLHFLKPGRLEALTDGTLAIVITVLALLLEPPEAHQSTSELLPALFEMWHDIAAFAVTFVLVALYWLQHHRIFHHLKATDSPLVWLNLLFLLFTATVPFATGLVLEYPGLKVAILSYGIAHLLASTSLFLLWRHVRSSPNLLHPDHHPDHHPDEARILNLRLTTTPILYGLAVLVGFFAIQPAKLLFVAVPLVYLAQGRLRIVHGDPEREA